ncbi:pyridoxamine 5'-phosphate oxidase family protein [Winogradskyella sp. DF17]|uniref:Pyridoxamine 5'-phosphate oxidase family protein n=2 Tax=Winogradskyella pelagia TaxID=2819984 RepID=A0ABS3T2K2_9FLAO|nr:pyridoxamine 5'-phosphate oxidase family protein [Winogradskyella sp. DF17]
MEQRYLEDIKAELINGYAKKRHPFRYFTLATVHKKAPRQRTVVLRKLLPDFNLLFFTDLRSQKVEDIKNNNTVSALFYHPKKLIQVKVDGKAQFVEDKHTLKTYWNNIPEHSRKDYITASAPGTPIANPDHTSYNLEQHHFCAIHIVPTTIEYLQLKRPNHLRLKFSKQEGGWQDQFLVP